MNSQREVIYRQRNALFGERISVEIANMMYDSMKFGLQKSLESVEIMKILNLI